MNAPAADSAHGEIIMLGYITRRTIRLIPLLFLISVLVFIIIQLPPGDYVTLYIQHMKLLGMPTGLQEVKQLQELYGLNQPIYIQYLKWMENILLHGNLGFSFQWDKPVSQVIAEPMALTIVITLLTTIFTWMLAIPIGIYSAVRQYTFFDYLITFLGFVGLAIPGFLLALVVMYVAFAKFGINVGGLFSSQYALAPWSLNKVLDLFKHVWIAVVIQGVAGIGSLVRIMRGTMLDELNKQYVMTARAKGMSEFRLIMKYPVRIAVNPLVSTIGWLLPWFVSGGTLVAIVLSLPTAAPILYHALLMQDMYLAGSFVLITSVLTVFGTLISDILLALVDPRIRFGKSGE
jgi:peptide/nickel transport system permease protein